MKILKPFLYLLLAACAFDLYRRQRDYRSFVDNQEQEQDIPQQMTIADNAETLSVELIQDQAFMTSYIGQKLDEAGACVVMHPQEIKCFCCNVGQEFLDANHSSNLFDGKVMHVFQHPSEDDE